MLVTIGIPVVKTKFFEIALQSALNQSYKDLEIIVINNKADFSLYNILKKYNDPRIKYYENEEQLPPVQNWNKVLSLANGKYFCLLSDDDYYEKDFVIECINTLLKYPDAKIVHTRVKIIDINDNIINFSPLCNEFETAIDFIWHRILGYRLQFLSDFLVVTKALKESNGFIEMPFGWGSDDLTWYKLASIGGVAFVSKPLFNYRYSEINLSFQSNIDFRIEATRKYIKILNEIITKLKLEDNEKVLYYLINKNISNWRSNQIIGLLVNNFYLTKNPIFKLIVYYFKNKKKLDLHKKILFDSIYLLIKKTFKTYLDKNFDNKNFFI